jgi:hypothetical protein
MTIETILNVKATASGGDSVKSIRDEIRKARQEAEEFSREFGAFSPQAIEAAKRLAKLKDEMEDLNERVAGLNPDKFQSIATVVGGVASGIQAAQGAMALFGSESEEVQKTLLKVQGAMAFAQGIQSLISMQNALAGVATMIKTQVVTAFSTLKGAILATGVGALVIGIGILIEQMNSLTDATKEAADAADKLFDSSQRTIALNDLTHQKYINQLKARGATEQEIQKASLDYQKRQIELLQEERKKAVGNQEKFDEEIQKRKMQMEINISEIELKQYEKRQDQATKAQEKRLALQKQDEATREKEAIENQKINDDRAKADAEYAEKTAITLQERLAAFEMLWALELKSEEKKHLTQEQILREHNLRTKDITEKFNAEQKELDEKRKADQLARAEDEYKKGIDAINKYYEDKANIEKQRYLTGEIDAKTLADNLQAIEQDKYARLLTEAADYGKDQTDIQKAALDQQVANKKAADEKMVADDKTKADALRKNQDDVMSATSSALGTLSQLYGAQTKKGKAFALAQIAIDTAKGISGAVAQAQTVGFPANIGAIAIGVSTVLANIAAAKRILGKEGETAPNVPSAATPQTFSVNNQSLRLNAPNGQSPMSRVYVLESDISNAQKRVNTNRQLSVY